MQQAYVVRQCFDKGQGLWLIESVATGNKLMFYSTQEKALSRCKQLMQLARESPSRRPALEGMQAAL